MIVVVSDTHAQTDPPLTDSLQRAISKAELVIHAGDFFRYPVLSAFEELAADLVAVHGNVDDAELRSQLPSKRIISHQGVTIALTHTVGGGETGLAAFGREQDAALVISGHTHRPGYRWTGELGLLNPGSHAEPRGHRPAYAELDIDETQVVGRLRETDGSIFERFHIPREGN